jgi:hypothetical protein
MKTNKAVLLDVLFAAIWCIGCSQSPTPRPDAGSTDPSVGSAIVTPPLPARLRGIYGRPVPNLGSPAPAKPDTRTPAQLAAAACAGGRCTGAAIPKLMSASGQQPIIPPTWTVPNWYIDPANSIACASDTNSGTTATCTGGCSGSTCPSGIGPLLTYQELNVHRWLCQGNPVACPRLRQATTVTFGSSQSSNSDPVYFMPAIEAAAVVTLTGPALSALTTGTLASVTAKVRASNTFPFQAAFTSGAVGQFVSCTHGGTTGYGWLNTNVSGSIFTESQPLAAQTTFVSSGCISGGTEVDTCTTSDSYTIYNTMPSVNIVRVEPTFSDNNTSTFGNMLTILHLTLLDPGGAGNDSMYLGDHVAVLESSVQRQIIQTASQLNVDQNALCLANVDSLAGVTNIASDTLRPVPSSNIVGGIVGGPVAYFTSMVGWSFFDDVLLNGNQGPSSHNSYIGASQINQGLFIATNTLAFMGGTQINSPAIVYGGGTLDPIFGRVDYPSGAGAAVTTFPISGGLQLDNQTKGCVAITSASSAFATCNITVSPTTLDADLGATNGCMATGAGASFCNYGP